MLGVLLINSRSLIILVAVLIILNIQPIKTFHLPNIFNKEEQQSFNMHVSKDFLILILCMNPERGIITLHGSETYLCNLFVALDFCID